jgi:hypothetical protein
MKWSIALVLLLAPNPSAGSFLEVAFPTIERLIVEGLLTEGGRRYLQGGPEDTCTYAFIQEPRVSSSEGRLQMRFLFAGSMGAEVAGRCAGRGGNFDIVVSGVPAYDGTDLFLDEVRFESENKLFDLFSVLVESQLRPLLRVPLRTTLETQFSELTTAGRVVVEELSVSEIRLSAESVTVNANLGIGVRP